MFIDAVPEQDATGVVAEYYQQQRALWGFLPNYPGAFGTRPDVAQAWNALNLTIRDGMDRRRFDIATIAAAARSFFTRVIDALGAQLDVQTAQTFQRDVLESLIVGRPVTDGVA